MTFKSETSRTILSVLGALLLSTTFVTAAVGPAKAAAPIAAGTAAPVAY